MDYYQESLELHKKNKGKIELKNKVPLENKHDLSVAYTPGVGQVCLEIAKDPELAREYTIKRNTVAIVTDGSSVLGLGNLGALAAIPVMEGKAALFKEFANVDAFPICLDTHDVEEIIKTIKHLAPVFGGINLEDIAAPKCFEIEARLKKELDIPVMHDDQHGTAVVVLAALINSFKLAGKNKEEAKIVINGAGAAGTAVAMLLIKYGCKQVIVCDSKGIIHKGRIGLDDYKAQIAEATNHSLPSGDLTVALKGADVFIGVSKAKLLTLEMIKDMAEKPIIYALANPEPEVLPEIAKAAGAFIMGTGRSDYPNQINNVLAFPGIFRGALDNEVKQITDQMLLAAAQQLAAQVTVLSVDKILPTPFEKGTAEAIAKVIK
jgi:malate dehydrogenase (oxaloacetate-decarboxylating)